MSRVAKSPVAIPSGVDVTVKGADLSIKGSKGLLQLTLNALVKVEQADAALNFSPVKESTKSWAMAGTMRSLVNNMVEGVANGFERKLILKGTWSGGMRFGCTGGYQTLMSPSLPRTLPTMEVHDDSTSCHNVGVPPGTARMTAVSNQIGDSGPSRYSPPHTGRQNTVLISTSIMNASGGRPILILVQPTLLLYYKG
jgi:hypothetical protein